MYEVKIETPDETIQSIADRALSKSDELKQDVFFIFKDFCVPVSQNDTVSGVIKRYEGYIKENFEVRLGNCIL